MPTRMLLRRFARVLEKVIKKGELNFPFGEVIALWQHIWFSFCCNKAAAMSSSLW